MNPLSSRSALPTLATSRAPALAGRGETPHSDDPHDGWIKTPESDGTLANLLSVRRFSNVQSSPEGSCVAFLQGGLRVQDSTGQESLVYPGSVGSYLWLNEDFLAFSYDRDGDEQWRLGLTRANGEPFATQDGSERAYLRLSDNEEASHQLCFASPAGLYYRSTKLDSSDSEIHRLDPKTGEHELIYRSSGQTEPVGVMPDGRLLVHQGLSNVDNNLLAYDRASGRSQLLTPHEGNCTFVPDAFVAPEQMLCLSNQGRETVTACLLNTGTGQLQPLFPSSWDTEAIAYQGDSGRLACVFNEDGYSRLGMFHLPSSTWASCPPLPEGVVSQLAWSGPDTLRFCFSGPDRPGSLAELHVRSGELRWLKEAEFARPPGLLVKPESVRYASHDGLTIPALLYRSPQDTGAAVVHLHGGPETQHRPRFDPLVQHLTSLGISVLAPNVRGSSGYGRTFIDADNGARRADVFGDVRGSAEFLKQSGFDPKRLGVLGSSYGGYLTQCALAFTPEVGWAAGASQVGMSNLDTFMETTGAWRKPSRAAEYGEDAEVLRSLSPIFQADRIQAPLLMIQGANDPRVPQAQADGMVSTLLRQGNDVEYLLFTDEGHTIARPDNALLAQSRTADFLRQHLLS